jgi:hypothetical protein
MCTYNITTIGKDRNVLKIIVLQSIIVFRFLFGIILGRFFTHRYDFEPIILYLNGSIKKIIISGKGDLESQSHRNDIFCSQSYLNEGKSEFYTQINHRIQLEENQQTLFSKNLI